MSKVETVKNAWQAAYQDLRRTPFFEALGRGAFTLAHYKVFLREIYYNTRENPQTFALMAAHLKGGKRNVAARIFRHCAVEFGHHDLALADLQALGVDTGEIPYRRPLPTTEAFTSFIVHQVQHRNPVAYIGYVSHLEWMATVAGPGVMTLLESIGVPEGAMSFLKEHAVADELHTKWNEGYIEELAETAEDLDAIIYGLRGSCKLHGLMLQGIIEAVDDETPWGLTPWEKPVLAANP